MLHVSKCSGSGLPSISGVHALLYARPCLDLPRYWFLSDTKLRGTALQNELLPCLQGVTVSSDPAPAKKEAAAKKQAAKPAKK